jgi:hypothetical protein
LSVAGLTAGSRKACRRGAIFRRSWDGTVNEFRSLFGDGLNLALVIPDIT